MRCRSLLLGKVIFRRRFLIVALVAYSSAQEPFEALYRVPTRVKASEAASERQLVTRIQPAYPETARQRCVQGDVVLSVIVAESGYVKLARAISGPVAGELLFLP